MSPSLRSPDRPAKIREVQPNQDRRTDGGGAASSVTGWEDAATIREEQSRLGADERAEVLVLDLERFPNAPGIEAVLGWARRYRSDPREGDSPVCLVVLGRKIRAADRRRLRSAGLHSIDLSRSSVRRLMGEGDRPTQLGRLLRPVLGVAAAAGPASAGSHEEPVADRWDAYATAPSHVDRRCRSSVPGARRRRRARLEQGFLTHAGPLPRGAPGRRAGLRHRRQTPPGQHPRPDGPWPTGPRPCAGGGIRQDG